MSSASCSRSLLGSEPVLSTNIRGVQGAESCAVTRQPTLVCVQMPAVAAEACVQLCTRINTGGSIVLPTIVVH
eukprot:19049-Heterococcus_DN1.PRE.2